MAVSIFSTTVPAVSDFAQERNEDALLVERVQAGHIAAFDALVHRYRHRLFSVVYNLTGNAEDTSDILQESFIKAFRAISRFQPNASFFTWLYRITLNTTTSFIRKRQLRRFFSFNQEDDSENASDENWAIASEKSADELALMSELQIQLNQALQGLPVKHRTAIVLFEIEGLSHAEIAQIMDCNEGTVRSRVHYAKEMLRTALKGYVKDGKTLN
jgi:RNA polymerase sigma factor (sigma-70 family)